MTCPRCGDSLPEELCALRGGCAMHETERRNRRTDEYHDAGQKAPHEKNYAEAREGLWEGNHR